MIGMTPIEKREQNIHITEARKKLAGTQDTTPVTSVKMNQETTPSG